MWYWLFWILAPVVLVAAIGVISLVIGMGGSAVEGMDTEGAFLDCFHCGRATRVGRKHCEHCGRELQ